MPTREIDNAAVGISSTNPAFSISSRVLDSPSNFGTTGYVNPNWSKYWGYFTQVPELKAAVLMKAIWNVGKGYEATPEVQVVLDSIRGMGKDTFEDILFNMEIQRYVNGDAFAEIIKDDAENLINLKPLDPSTVYIQTDKKGILTGYEVVSATNGKPNEKFKPEEIFHLTNNRIGNQVHGISDIEAIEKIILAEAESFEITRKVIKNQYMPFIIFKMKTDDTTKIANFKEKVRLARKESDDMFIPDDENLLSWEVVQVNPSPIILSWREDLKNKFARSLGIPLVLLGTSGGSEANGKVQYLGHENVFEHNQRYLEGQINAQLGLKIDLIGAAKLLDNLQADEGKDAQNALTLQQSDVTAGGVNAF